MGLFLFSEGVYQSGIYDGISIQDVYSLYQFDKGFRNLLLLMLEDIEVAFRTHISYLIAHKYGALGYKDCRNFKNKSYHNGMLKNFDIEVDRSDEIFVAHQKNGYGGVFPIWVVIEVTSFGVLFRIISSKALWGLRPSRQQDQSPDNSGAILTTNSGAQFTHYLGL